MRSAVQPFHLEGGDEGIKLNSVLESWTTGMEFGWTWLWIVATISLKCPALRQQFRVLGQGKYALRGLYRIVKYEYTPVM
jgi:hypothetical protein